MRVALLALVTLLAACSRNIQTTEAVRQAVIDDIRARSEKVGLNVDAMDVTVSSVSFGKDEARASVNFSVKGQPASGGMSMDYILARKGSNWAVTARQMSAAPQSSPGELPPGHPPAGRQP